MLVEKQLQESKTLFLKCSVSSVKSHGVDLCSTIIVFSITIIIMQVTYNFLKSFDVDLHSLYNYLFSEMTL